MPLPPPVEALWNELQAVRAEILKEIEGLSQAQADWRPSDRDWSVGEIIHHLTLAEVATGKLTSKLFKEAGVAVAPFPADVTGFAPFPPSPPGPAEAPPAVRRAAGDGRPALAQVGASAVRRTRSRSVVDAPGAARRGPSPATPRGEGCRRLPPGVITHAVSTA